MDRLVDETIIWQNLFQGLDFLSQGYIQDIKGGQRELPKCFYYFLHWVIDSEGHTELAASCKNAV
jgi:hypothetical protein